MATYKQTVGTAVTNYAGDKPGAVEGELWYDSTNQHFKYQYPNTTTSGSWSTGGNLNAPAGKALAAGAGTKTAGIIFGGDDDSGPTIVGNTEQYNGSSWTEVADLNTARRDLAGSGLQTAALAFSGANPGSSNKTETETWNGSS